MAYVISYLEQLEKFKQQLSQLTETQKAYLAGILDGEGSLGLYQDIRRTTNSILLRVVVITNKDEKLVNTIYGWINQGKVKIYKATGGYKNITIHHRAFAEVFLKTIYKYLLAKQERAKMTLEFINLRKGRFHHPYTERELELVSLSKKGNFIMGKAVKL